MVCHISQDSLLWSDFLFTDAILLGVHKMPCLSVVIQTNFRRLGKSLELFRAGHFVVGVSAL